MTLVPHPPLAEDPGPPYLVYDVSPWSGAHPALEVPEGTDVDGDGDADYRGAIFKATEGTVYGHVQWFLDNFRHAAQLTSANRGRSTLLGGYPYVKFNRPGRAQADFYLDTMFKAGWTPGLDIAPIVDAERGDERNSNYYATASQVVDCISAFAERCRERTGRGVILYGRGIMRDLGITSRMGCDRVWLPGYTAKMPLNGITKLDYFGHQETEWTVDDVVLWQYAGDGVGAFRKLPWSIPGFTKNVDISVFVDGNRKPTLARMLERLQ